MAKINHNFDNLVPNYLFADVARKTNEFIKANSVDNESPKKRCPLSVHGNYGGV